MKKTKIFAVVMAAVMTLSMVACGEKTGNEVTPTTAPTTAPTEAPVADPTATPVPAPQNVTIADGKIEATEATKAVAFTIEKSGDVYTIKSESGYYIGHTSDANKLSASTDTQYTNTITMNEDGSVNVICSGGAYLRFNANVDQMRFRYYKSGTYTKQKAITLYKLVEE